MDKIPALGGARGLFEIFVPGTFLLLNLFAAVYLWPFASDPVSGQLTAIFANTSASLIATITLGYLLGVVLRLLRCEVPDRLSAGFLRLTNPQTYGGETAKNRWAYERFPFTERLKDVCRELMPPNVLKFYETVWEKRSSKHFFNLCKLVVASEDPKAAEEVYSAEALCRHISGMFYALAASMVAIISVDIAIWISRGSLSFVLTLVVLVYFVSTLVILSNFRFMRLKEVDTVFAASYRNRDKIEYALRATTVEVGEKAEESAPRKEERPTQAAERTDTALLRGPAAHRQ